LTAPRGRAARLASLAAAAAILVLAALAIGALRNHLFISRAREITAVAFSGPAVEAAGGTARVTVEVAVTGEERRRGLAGRTGLEPGTGMLFVYRDQRPRRFTMEGMLFGLDIISISTGGWVTGVATRSPGDPAFETDPARYVLEVAAGWAAAHGVAVGARAELIRGG